MMDEVCVVWTTAPDSMVADKLARELVEARVAACVSVLGVVRSTYRWHGAVEQADEVQLVIKTTRGRYEALERKLLEVHPYEVPELLLMPVGGGGRAFLDWVREESSAL